MLVKNVEIHFKNEATLMKISAIDKVLMLMSTPNNNNIMGRTIKKVYV